MDREKKITPLIRRGSFRVGYKNEKKLVIICVVGFVLCVGMCCMGLAVFGKPVDFMGFMSGSFWAVPAVLCLILIPVIRYGRSCTYSFSDTEMEIVTPKGRDYLYYSDIKAVNYTPMLSGGKQRGWLVNVVTGFREYSYRCLLENPDELIDTDQTPFYVLEINSGLKQEEEITQSASAEILSRFDIMQGQQTQRRIERAKRRPLKERLMDDDEDVLSPEMMKKIKQFLNQDNEKGGR